jgi:N-acetylmuramoyl-L-alanine amidase
MYRLQLILLILIGCSPLVSLLAGTPSDPFTIVIDPGHGGKDPGALGSIVREKDVVLDVALRFGQLIRKNHPDVKIIYTRNTDVFPKLYERPQIANKAKADLFISIHADYSDNKSAHGPATFTLGQNRTMENFEIAKRENAVILLEENYEQRYEGFDPNSAESYIMFEFMQDNYMNHSIKLASTIQNKFKDSGRSDRGVRQDVFLVLKNTSMPSVLVELGFLTNKEEELFLKSDEGKDQLADCLLRAFTDFKKDYDRKTGVPVIADNQSKSNPTLGTTTQGTSTVSVSSPSQTDIEFSIQLLASSSKLPQHDERFKGYSLNNYFEKGYYKYTYGTYYSFEEANQKRRELLASFPDAFIIAFKKGKRIPVNEARNELLKESH